MTTGPEHVEQTPERDAQPRAKRLTLGHSEVLADDGTMLRAWTNDPEGRIVGPTVVLCNGLGTGPWAWPGFFTEDPGVRVVSWYHRGVGGSARPHDPDAVDVEVSATDAVSVMDHFGIDRAVLVGWSLGVNTMYEVATLHPERVSGLFAVCGVPGDTFATMLEPLRLPRWVSRATTRGLSMAVRQVGGLLTPISTRLPIGPRAIKVISHSGFMLPVPDDEMAALAIRDFLTTPLDWYFHLAVRSSEHPRVSLSRITVPAFFVAGRYDVLAGSRAMRSAAERMREATYVELPSSHFAQMEHPDVVHTLLQEFVEEVER
ncbi:MAG: alpha/beta fold hydrolase [Nocardioides sp.]|uniref:alpha/beta fold hydrolase n=1 Tax=Nocardioides sp. TaxID=35761 RepID=UPI003F0471AA